MAYPHIIHYRPFILDINATLLESLKFYFMKIFWFLGLHVMREMLKDASKDILAAALTTASTDPINNIIITGIITPGNKVKSYSELILCNKGTEEFNLISLKFVYANFGLMKGNLRKEDALNTMWSKIHSYSTSKDARLLWNELCIKVGINAEDIHHYYIF